MWEGFREFCRYKYVYFCVPHKAILTIITIEILIFVSETYYILRLRKQLKRNTAINC